MNSQDLNLLDGRLRRTTYAIAWDMCILKTDTLTKKQVEYLSARIKSALADAVNDSMEYMESFGIIKTYPVRSTKKKKSKARK